MNVGGTLYDVTFVDGTCTALFDGCDEASDFTFTTQTDADAASQALLDFVFVDVPGLGSFDSAPEFTFGITSNTAGFVFTPYNHEPGLPFLSTFAAVNKVSGDFTAPVALGKLDDTFANPSTVFADWTVATVPIPAGGMLLLSALGGIAALRRRVKSTV